MERAGPRTRDSTFFPAPGCARQASRPWALSCNAFGVFQQQTLSLWPDSVLVRKRRYTTKPRVARLGERTLGQQSDSKPQSAPPQEPDSDVEVDPKVVAARFQRAHPPLVSSGLTRPTCPGKAGKSAIPHHRHAVSSIPSRSGVDNPHW